MPNGIVPENGLPLPDRRAGKKHKRNKNSSKMVDGKLEQNENIEDSNTVNQDAKHCKF